MIIVSQMCHSKFNGLNDRSASPTLKVSHNALFYTLLVYAVVGRIEMIPLGMISICLKPEPFQRFSVPSMTKITKYASFAPKSPHKVKTLLVNYQYQ